jgi:hypothetical protein
MGMREFKQGQIVWIRHIEPPQCVWDETLNNFREYLPHEPREMICEGFINKVGKINIHVMCNTGGHNNGKSNMGKFDKGTLIEDSGKYGTDYTLHLTLQHAIDYGNWMMNKPIQ